MGTLPPLEGPLSLSLEFTYEWPKKRPPTAYRCSRPDLDNLVKMVADGLNEVCWQDDQQIVDLRAVKLYGDVPGISIRIVPIAGEGNANGSEDTGGVS